MEHSIRTEREIERVLGESQLLNRQEAIEILAIVNHHIHKSSLFSAFWGVQTPGTQTLDSHTPLNTQVATTGQEGILDLQSLRWTPVERNHQARVGSEMPGVLGTAQQSENANETGTKNEEMVPSLQAVLNGFRVASRCKRTGF